MKLALGSLVYHDFKTEKKTIQLPSFEVLTESPELNLSREDIDKLSDWLFQDVNLMLHGDNKQLAIVNGASLANGDKKQCST